ncbi:MAG: deoxyribodipyrimidine photolyase [Acetobacteraceae bacterium]|nr:deoxyribodipyrimidine photolyase [Acetobacteraceae bacterium]MDW8398060.1 FAD-binding domain-containing protein [Acetobacteraceae bacterium]
MPEFPTTRSEALARLAAFAPRMGRAYAARRNADLGPGRHEAVSRLSPAIRHRLLTEAEVVGTALAAHGPEAAGKFVEEVFWRSYWKGWLELRPSVWAAYRAGLARQVQALATRGGLRKAHAAACRGETGIACFDAWARELAATGYLHNHARMWFASIWIFTLRLPWELGADLFLRQLRDGDPASNTLSWRWVGGLQTPGKHYLARAENIARWTEGRFDPRGELEEQAAPLPPEPLPAPGRLPPREEPPPGPAALLLHEEDLGVESLDVGPARIVAAGGFVLPEARSPLLVSPAVARHLAAALSDGLARAEARFGAPAGQVLPDAVPDWAKEAGVRTVLTPEAPAGWTAEALARIEAALAERGLRLVRLRRAWDEACWPLATRGFFAFRGHIPELARRLAA